MTDACSVGMPRPQPVELRIRPSTIWMLALHAGLAVAAVWIVYRVRAVLSWVLLALVLALALDPMVRALERRGLRRWMAVLLVTILAAGLVAALGVTFVPMLIEQVRALAETVPAWLDELRKSAVLTWVDARIDIMDELKSRATAAASAIAGSAVAFVGGLVYTLAGAVTVAVLAIFMLLSGPPLFRSAIELVSPSRRDEVVELASAVRRSVGGYVAGALVIALIGGVVTTVTLLALGVPYYLPLGLAMVFLGLIPYVGSAVGAVLVVSTTVLSSGLTNGVIALAVFLIYQQIEGNILQPVVQRRTIRMNALLIAIAMLLGTAMAGIMGTVLALPVAGSAQVAVQRFAAKRKRRFAAASSPTSADAPEETAPPEATDTTEAPAAG